MVVPRARLRVPRSQRNPAKQPRYRMLRGPLLRDVQRAATTAGHPPWPWGSGRGCCPGRPLVGALPSTTAAPHAALRPGETCQDRHVDATADPATPDARFTAARNGSPASAARTLPRLLRSHKQLLAIAAILPPPWSCSSGRADQRLDPRWAPGGCARLIRENRHLRGHRSWFRSHLAGRCGAELTHVRV